MEVLVKETVTLHKVLSRYLPPSTLMQRRKTKAQELAGLDPLEAELLGLQRMSERTLIRLSAPHVEELVLACADGRC